MIFSKRLFHSIASSTLDQPPDSCMKLRDHPLLSYHGVSSWPPVWVGKDARPLEQPTSELAILKKVMLSTTAPLNRCFITIEHEDKEYLGAVLFDDQFSC